MQIIKPSKDIYYICYDNISTCHSGYMPNGTSLETGQPFVELFDTEEEMLIAYDKVVKDCNIIY